MHTGDWNNLQIVAKDINNYFISKDMPLQITMGLGKKVLYDDLEKILELILDDTETYPDLPGSVEWARSWYEQRKGTQGRNYVRHFRDYFTPKLAKLKKKKLIHGNDVFLFLAMRDAANDSHKTNKSGLQPGEMCRGNKRLAKDSGIYVSSVSASKKRLMKAGLIKFMRRLWKEGPYVYWVDMGWEGPYKEQKQKRPTPKTPPPPPKTPPLTGPKEEKPVIGYAPEQAKPKPTPKSKPTPLVVKELDDHQD